MRRFTLSVLFALFTIAGMAAELNIYASGLRLHGATPVTGQNQVHIDYFLNAPATDLKFVVLDATTGDEKTSVTIPAGTSNANYTKGLHEDVVVDLSSFFGAGETYKWAIRAINSTANTSLTKISDSSAKFILYAPKGVTVNAYPETDAFGTIYVSMPADGQSDGSSATSKAQKQGIFVWNPKLDLINTGNAGFKGDLTWQTDNAYGAYRLKVAENGDLYMGASHDNVHNLYKISSDYSHFEPLLGHSPKVSGFEIVGNNVYTMEGIGYDNTNGCLGNLVQYSINDLPVSAVGTIYATAATTKTGNAQTSLDSDGKGGFWICQYRSTDAAGMPVIAHLSTSKTIDWNSSTAGLGLSVSTRGAMGVSPDKSLLAVCTGAKGAKKLYLYSIAWSGTTPALTKISEASVGNNVDGVAFDYANNLYSVNSSSELLYVWATPKSTNSCTTPAASSRTIVLESYIPEKHVTGVTLDETSKTVTVGESFTLTATVAPNDASNKTISWSTSNSSVATVADGVVTTKAVGTATITVTTTDGNKTATCDVTVDPKAPLAGSYNIGGANPDYATLYDAISDLNSWGIGGDVTFLICGNLTEANNIGLVNTSAYNITIRPDADADRTITFTKTADNGGPSGAFIIGAPFGIADMTAVNTANITIDGLATAEATHKMKLEVSSSFGSNAGVVVFYGGITNTTLKNCKVVNNMNVNTYRAHCVAIRSTASAYPDGIIIENNEITSMTAGYGCPIYINGSASTSNPPANTIIRNNEIIGKRDAILFNYCNNLTIENNIFRIKGSNGVLGKAIGNYSGTAQSSGNIIIRKNQFVELLTNNGYDNNGFIAIEAVSGGNWTIENNFITGFDAVTNSRKGELIGIKTGSTPSSITIQHNTMFMPAFSKTITSSLLSGYPVSLIYIAAGSPVVKNNILANMETECVSSIIRGTLNANCLGNVYYSAGTNGVVVDGSKACANWTEFQTQYATQAASSKWQQVALVDNYKFAPEYVSNANLLATPMPEVTTDIEGRDRNTTITSAGCYEASVEVTGVSISQSNMAIAPGDYRTLTAEVTPNNATDPTITWSSDAPTVVSITASGIVTAHSTGTAHITAKAGSIISNPITIEVANPVAHVLPYNLNRVLNNDKNSYTFSFKSNIAATSGKLVFYQGGVLKGEVAITDPIVAGENSVYVAKTSLPQIDGEMTWAVELSAAESKVIGELTNKDADIYKFYHPRGVAVDNSPESPYFGQIYITEPLDGATDGGSDWTKAQKAGLYVFDAQYNSLNPTPNQGYSFGLSMPATTMYGFKRVNVDAQGNVYVNSTTAIYKANPADLTTSTTLAANKFTAINSFCIDGDIFYVMDNGTALKKLEAGNVTEIATEASHLVNSDAADNNIVQDGHGGWWIAQSRANSDVYYSLCHVNAAKEIDFTVLSSNQAILGDCSPKSTRGGLALNSDKTILAMGSNSTVIFFDLAYDSNGTPTITRKPWTLPTLGYHIDGVAFDYADNLYVVSATTERFYAYSLPKADNTTLVPAKSTLTVDAQQHIAVTSITLSQTSASLEIGETLDLTATCLPNDATSKTVEWSSDNTAVAEVNPTTGRVTAVSVGTAHITATSTVDGVNSETCEISVYKLDFTVTWETNGASYTTTQLSSNSDLWSQFMTGYNTYYEAKGKSHRDIQPMTAVSVFAYHGVIDLLTDPVSPWKWLGDYMLATADAQSVTLTKEYEWKPALQDFFSCTSVIVDFATAGQVAQWLPLWKTANNYLPATMRATDAMPTIEYGNNTFVGWYDNAQFSGSPVTSVTADITLYAKWYAPLELDELASDNAAAIAENNGRTLNVIFNRRFEVAEGWYTLVLPFDLTAAQMAEAFGAGYRLMELEDAYKKSETMLYVRFGEAYALEAGKPYLFQTGMDITEDIVFSGVTIDNSGTLEVDADEIKMIGLYNQTIIDASPVDFYLGQGNYLYEYLTPKTTKGFRAFFRFKNEQLANMVVARVIFRDDVTTDLEDETFETAPAVQKIIRNGQLIIIRDGIEYNAQGQVIK